MDRVAELAAAHSRVVVPVTTDAKNILSRVAALVGVMVLSDLSGVVDSSFIQNNW